MLTKTYLLLRIRMCSFIGAVLTVLLFSACGDDGGTGSSGSPGTFTAVFSEYDNLEISGSARFGNSPPNEHGDEHRTVTIGLEPRESSKTITQADIFVRFRSVHAADLEATTYLLSEAQSTTLSNWDVMLVFEDTAYLKSAGEPCAGEVVIASASAHRIRGSLDITCPGWRTYRTEDGASDTVEHTYWLKADFDANPEQ